MREKKKVWQTEFTKTQRGHTKKNIYTGLSRTAYVIIISYVRDINYYTPSWIYFTWPQRKHMLLYKQATRGPTALSPFRGTRQ